MASVRDIILAMVVVFMFGLGFFVINYALNTTFNSMIQVEAINQSAGTVAVFEGTQTGLLGKLDYIVLGLFIGLTLGIIVTGYFLGGYPIFAFFYFIVLIIGVVLSAVMSNVWETFSTTAIFGTTINAFPLTNHLMNYLPYYCAVVGFIGIVAMFAKPLLGGAE